jgi:hypothetical protein
MAKILQQYDESAVVVKQIVLVLSLRYGLSPHSDGIALPCTTNSSNSTLLAPPIMVVVGHYEAGSSCTFAIMVPGSPRFIAWRRLAVFLLRARLGPPWTTPDGAVHNIHVPGIQRSSHVT